MFNDIIKTIKGTIVRLCILFLKLNVRVLVIKHLLDKKREGEGMIHTALLHASELGCECHAHLSQRHQGPAVGVIELLTRVC